MNKSAMLVYLQARDRFQILHCSSSKLRRIILPFALTTVFTLLGVIVASRVARAAEDFDSVFDKANLNYRQGKYEEALGLYKRANGIKAGTNLECLWGMAQTYSKLGAHKNTLQTCDRLIQISGDDMSFLAKAWNLRGNTLSAVATQNPGKLDEAKLREAEAAFREVLKISSSLNMAHYNLGITLIRLNRINEGLGELRSYLKNAEEEDVAEKARKIIENPRRAVESFAPDFSIITSDGEYISSDELRGKVLLMDFWGIWCKPCLSAVPFLSRLAKKYNEQEFVLIGVDVNDEEAKWREFISENRMNWTQTRDSNNKIQRSFQINAFPTYVLIDHEGIIRYRGKGSGPQTEGEVSEGIKKAMKALAASGMRPRVASAGSSPSLITESVPAPLKDSAQDTRASSAPVSDADTRGVEGKRAFVLRIPKPVMEVTPANIPNMPSEMQNRNSVYTLRIKNWASMPDELFASSKDLLPCSAGASMPMNAASTRLEVLISNEQGQLLRAYCSLPKPEILQSLLLMIPNQIRPGRIYLTLKDRLTGNLVHSDLVALP